MAQIKKHLRKDGEFHMSGMFFLLQKVESNDDNSREIYASYF